MSLDSKLKNTIHTAVSDTEHTLTTNKQNNTKKIILQSVAFSANRHRLDKMDKHPSNLPRPAKLLKNTGYNHCRRKPVHLHQKRSTTANKLRKERGLAKEKQAGNGPNRRHIQGSKIAKGLQSIKYSLLKYPHEEKN